MSYAIVNDFKAWSNNSYEKVVESLDPLLRNGALMGDEDVDGGVMGGTCTTSLTFTDIS